MGFLIDDIEIERRFNSHEMTLQQLKTSADIRSDFIFLGKTLVSWLPEGREKSLAITALEEASFWAQAAIAREGT